MRTLKISSHNSSVNLRKVHFAKSKKPIQADFCSVVGAFKFSVKLEKISFHV